MYGWMGYTLYSGYLADKVITYNNEQICFTVCILVHHLSAVCNITVSPPFISVVCTNPGKARDDSWGSLPKETRKHES